MVLRLASPVKQRLKLHNAHARWHQCAAKHGVCSRRVPKPPVVPQWSFWRLGTRINAAHRKQSMCVGALHQHIRLVVRVAQGLPSTADLVSDAKTMVTWNAKELTPRQ